MVITDEAAFVESLPKLLKAALAFLMWGGQVIVCSTHDGADNPFNQLIQDVLGGRLPYKHDRIDFDQARRDGLYQRICLVTLAALDFERRIIGLVQIKHMLDIAAEHDHDIGGERVGHADRCQGRPLR